MSALRSEVMRAHGEQQDDRDRNAQEIEQNGAHGRFLSEPGSGRQISSGTWAARAWRFKRPR
jgi:hypothetical protein